MTRNHGKMKINSILSFVTAFLLFQAAFVLPADATDRYWHSFRALVDSTGIPTDVELQQRSPKKKLKMRTGDYQLKCHDKRTKKDIQTSRFVWTDGQLFINLKGLRTEDIPFRGDFCYCMRIDSANVAFLAPRMNNAIYGDQPLVADAVLDAAVGGNKEYTYDPYTGKLEGQSFGVRLLNGLIGFSHDKHAYKKKIAADRTLYLYSLTDSSQVHIITPEILSRLLRDHIDLMTEYWKMEPQYQRDPSVMAVFIARAIKGR